MTSTLEFGQIASASMFEAQDSSVCLAESPRLSLTLYQIKNQNLAGGKQSPVSQSSQPIHCVLVKIHPYFGESFRNSSA